MYKYANSQIQESVGIPEQAINALIINEQKTRPVIDLGYITVSPLLIDYQTCLEEFGKPYKDVLIDKGTDAGGAIEVYSTVEDAEKRRDYLATYDGTIFANGTHTVIGTVLVRTSNELTASQQKELEQKVIEALTKLD